MKRKIILMILTICLTAFLGCARNGAPGDSPSSGTSSLPADSSSLAPSTPSDSADDRVTIARTGDAQEFKPIGKDQDYGMILFKSSGFALEKDGESTVELFVKAEQYKGEIAWDDGQSWYLIVRDGDSAFKLLDNVYVQLGQVDYWAYWSYDEDAPHLLVMVRQGAGIEEFNFTYDRDKDVFYRETVFKTEGNISVMDTATSSSEK